MAPPKNYLIDMDGVLISGGTMIPGADRFLERLKARGAEFLVLTNTPTLTPGDLAHRFKTQGLDIPRERISRRPWPPPSSFMLSSKMPGPM